MDKLMLTTEETAEALGVCRTTAYRLIVSKRLPAVRVGGLWRVPVESLRRWIAEHTTEAET